jgi:hypothetical protein
MHLMSNPIKPRRKVHIEPDPVQTSADAIERRRTSVAVLDAEGVPYIDHLPVLAVGADVRPRTPREVAVRAVALAFVSAVAEGVDPSTMDAFIAPCRDAVTFSPDEQTFLGADQPDEDDRLRLSWRYESMWSLLWALGRIDELGRPDHMCDVPMSTSLVEGVTATSIIEEATLRDERTLLDQADLTYCYMSAVRQSMIDGVQPPAGLHPGVVYERLQSFN